MNDILFYVALATALFSAGVWLTLFVGVRFIDWLRDVEVPADFAWPRVSIIVPARNEEREIEAALQSVLHLDYPDYEVMVVNDRSTDGTGAILERMQSAYPQLRVATVTELPRGWLGKNHAMYFGAQQASGELLLFTDADIVMRPDTLRRAVYYLEREKLDLLPMTPRVDMPSFLLESFVTMFTILFLLYTRPWLSRYKWSNAHVGIGAFNLIRRSVYQAIGTHQAIAMRPDDDLKLGKLVKKSGYQHALVNAGDFLSVRWYASLRELVRGLEKNAFSGVEYSVVWVLLPSVLMLIVNVWPFLAVWMTRGAVWWLYMATITMHLASYLATARSVGARWWGMFAYPIACLLFVYIQCRTMIINLWTGGIQWRDTHYSLAELKANKV